MADLKAWQAAVCGRRGDARPELLKCLARALCLATSTTSACERDFSHLLMSFHKRAASPHLKEMQLRIAGMLQTEPGLRDKAIRMAQEIWRHGFNPQRQSGGQRRGNFVSGVKHLKKKCALAIHRASSNYIG